MAARYGVSLENPPSERIQTERAILKKLPFLTRLHLKGCKRQAIKIKDGIDYMLVSTCGGYVQRYHYAILTHESIEVLNKLKLL